MGRIEELPLELWEHILAYLDEGPPRIIHEFDATVFAGRRAKPPLKNLSTVCKQIRTATLPILFTYVQLQQSFSERNILKNQDVILTRFLEFIVGNGLRRHNVHFTLRVMVDEKKKGVWPILFPIVSALHLMICGLLILLVIHHIVCTT